MAKNIRRAKQVTEAPPTRASFEHRNRDLDPQLVWRGKDGQDWSDLVVPAPPLFIQEKIRAKALIDDLLRRSSAGAGAGDNPLDLFADAGDLPDAEVEIDADAEVEVESYQHDASWSNRMILGDSLNVMASLAEREGLRGQVQCIYVDPPYGIKFNSNFQWSTTSRAVKDGNVGHITREPEQVKAFRDTWRDGIHSYLTYLRDRLTVARDLLAPTGSIFVQIGEANVHRIRVLMDEIFGERNCLSMIAYKTLSPLGASGLPSICDYLLWYAKDPKQAKFRGLFQTKEIGRGTEFTWVQDEVGVRRKLSKAEKLEPERVAGRIFSRGVLYSSGYTPTCVYDFELDGKTFSTSKKSWRTNPEGMARLIKADRLIAIGKLPYFVQFFADFQIQPLRNVWLDTRPALDKRYVVQTARTVVQRCILMASDPGDLVLDPTCGSGTTAHVAEQWGRRWITIDTSRVALALARARIMGARYPYYLLEDSREGQLAKAKLTRAAVSTAPVSGDVRHGFVYERIPRITLKAIAHNLEIDVIWDQHHRLLEPLRARINAALGTSWGEWEIPRQTDPAWSAEVAQAHAAWWEHRVARQREIDASIAASAEFECLYDKPQQDRSIVRVAGPFTVESLSPHRTLGVDERDELIEPSSPRAQVDERADFAAMILENLAAAGVQQAHKQDRIGLTSVVPWPGHYICARAHYMEGEQQRRAGIFIGPEFGTVTRQDLVLAAREAADADFDILVSCAFCYEAHATDFTKLGRIPVVKARMNADLHMAGDLKTTSKANLFVVFGEPDVDIVELPDGEIQVEIKGVDVFHPNTGEVRSDGAEGIACWFLDTDYDEHSFFVRHAYFLGASDPYEKLRRTLEAEIDRDAWESLHSATSRPFAKPAGGRIAVKVINHLGDEVMKVFKMD